MQHDLDSEERDVKIVNLPNHCAIAIAAPGSEKANTTIKADKEDSKIHVNCSGKMTNESMLKHAETFDIETKFSASIEVDKKYDVSKAKAEYTIGYIFITVPVNSERMIDIA